MNISKSIKKVDTLDKMNGSAQYVSDIVLEGMLYAHTVRSIHPYAKILKVSIPDLPEGYYTVDHSDLPSENITNMIYDDWPIFAEDIVKYIGEPILFVVGEDKEVIYEITKQIKVEYEVLTPTFEYTNNVIDYNFTKGDPVKSFKDADRTITFDYQTGYQEQLYIEPQGMIGYLDGDKMTLIGSLQCPYYVKDAVVRALQCKEDQVRVIQSVVGGAFGGKEEYPSMIACQLAVAINKIKKPIKLIFEREEDVIVTTKRHPSKITLEASIKDGEITGIRSVTGIDSGAYIGLSGVVLSRALIASTGVYTIDNLDIRGSVFETHTVPNGAYRGFGAPQMLFSVEMFIEHVAKELNQDPLSLRLKYLAKQNDATSTGGEFRDPIIMDQMINKAMEISGYKQKLEEYKNPNSSKGIGMSFSLHGCGFTGSGESDHINALVKLRKDELDFVHILIAAVDMGQGVKTTMKKIVANICDIPMDQVIYKNPDTDVVPDSGPTVASRTIMIVGGLIARAAKQLKETWNSNQEQIVEERYQQPEYIKWDEKHFIGDAYPAYSWAVNVVEVEVSPVTFEVEVTGVWSVYDVGKAIDERIVKGQCDGGVAQGIGYGYLEVMNHQQGKIMQKNVTDYIIPTTGDLPLMETVIMDNPYPLGPYGAKGAGELSLVGGAPAVAKAIECAMNIKVQQIPFTPEMIMVSKQKQSKHTGGGKQ